MTTTRSPSTPALRPTVTGSGRRRRPPLLAAAVASAGTAALAVSWLRRPDGSSHVKTSSALLREWLTVEQVALVQLGLGVLGLVAAVAALTVAPGRRAPAWLLPVGLVVGLGTGVGLLGVQVITGAGYAVAVLVPLAALFIGVQLVRRGGPGRWMAFVAAGAVAAVAVVVFQQPATARLGDLLARLVVEWPRQMLAPYWLLGTALTWLVVAARSSAATQPTRRAARFVLRHRRAITVLAALGPLPYALVRLSWLSPWPLLATEGELTTDIRVWGLLLSSGAWAGVLLTLGLIRPWGEVFPRWMPGVAGRPVPVWFAAVPGGGVAGVLCASAVPMILMFAEQGPVDALVSALVFPLWCWGPALALAVWGYVLHRRGTGDRVVRSG